jgi:hypothetical protein
MNPLLTANMDGIVNPPELANVNTASSTGADAAVKFLYDNEDLFETLVNIKHPNVREESTERMLGLIKFPLPTPGLKEMQRRLEELSSSNAQFGLDEFVLGESNHDNLLLDGHTTANAVAWAGGVLDARRLLKRGVVPSLRPILWRRALGLEANSSAAEAYSLNNLLEECHRLDVVTDELFVFDVQTVVDDPKFFVFEVSAAIYRNTLRR